MSTLHIPLAPEPAKINVQAGRILAMKLAPYLATPLLRMVVVATDQVPTAASDARWRFYYNPTFMAELTAENAAAIWLHEVGHCLRGHTARWVALNQPNDRHHLFNIAGDLGINADIDDITPHLPPDAVRFNTINAAGNTTVERGMSTEEIYRLLTQDTNDQGNPQSGSPEGNPQPPQPGGGPTKGPTQTHAPQTGWDCGSAAGGDARKWEIPDTAPEDGSLNDGQADLIRQATAIEIDRHQRALGRGTVPAGIRRWAESILTPSVDWRKELRSTVSRTLAQQAGRRDYSYSRPSRRQIANVISPAMVRPAPPQVAVIIDTSGSMDEADLGQALADVAALAKKAGRDSRPVKVISCDASAGHATTVRSLKDVQLVGGGGTDMRVGIEAAANMKPAPEVIITITDGDTPWPEAAPAANPRARYIAVITNDRRKAPDWMTTINVDPRSA